MHSVLHLGNFRGMLVHLHLGHCKAMSTSCVGSRAICPRPCTPHAAAQLQPIRALHPARHATWIFMMDRQRLALGCSVEYGVIHINYVVTWTSNQSVMVTLTFDLLTLKVVSESRVTWTTSVPILVFLGLFLLHLGPMYATDRRTSDKSIA